MRKDGPVSWSEPRPDVLGEDWVARTMPVGDDGVATLVHRSGAGSRPRAMVYIHGFTDYFFQTHHAAVWEAHGYDVYAIDLHDCGRSIRPGRTPHFVADLAEYDDEIGAALALARSSHDVVVLDGHSTGGLIAALYVHDHPGSVDALVLNSPWFDLNASWFDRVVSTRVIDRVGARQPKRQVATLGDAYGRALHVSTGGEWDYDLAWKPLEGFPVLAGWLRAIRRGHARLARGLAITVPVLLATSGRAGHRSRPTAADLAGADCVLDPAHMWARAPLLGPRVRVLRVPGGRHDLTLSERDVRDRYDALLQDWLARVLP